jgi:hypothetical protein
MPKEKCIWPGSSITNMRIDVSALLEHRTDVHRADWGARAIDRLPSDLREAFPDMKGFSPRNLKYMRAFAAVWRKRAIVQEALAPIPWYHHIATVRPDAGIAADLKELGYDG